MHRCRTPGRCDREGAFLAQRRGGLTACARAQVPDVFQIIVKEKGVFTNVTSPSTKAKLRILFEVAPLALLVRRIAREVFVGGPASHPGNALHVAAPALLLLLLLPQDLHAEALRT